MIRSPLRFISLPWCAAAVLVTGLLLWAPYVQGLYTDAGQFVAFWQVGLSLLFVLVGGLVERRPFGTTPVRLSALALWLAYVAALVVAVSFRQAVQEVYKFGLYLMVLVVVSELVRTSWPIIARLEAAPRLGGEANSLYPAITKRARRRAFARGRVRSASPSLPLPTWRHLLTLFWAAAAIFALATLLSAVGLLPVEQIINQRVWTLMGYPNSAGALLGAAMIIGASLRRAVGLGGWPVDALLSGGQWLLGTTFILSMSRGAWLVTPFGLGALLIMWPPGHRLLPIVDLALTGIASVAVAPLLTTAYGSPTLGAGLLALGLALGVGAGWLSRRYQALGAKLRHRLAVAAMLLAVAVPVGLLATGALPDFLADRLTGFSLSEESAYERIAWTKDAWSIVKDYPILGAGGGAWSSLYFSYQSFSYITAEVHNDFLEIWVETGTVGFGSLLAFLGFASWTAWRLRDRVDRRLLGGVTGAAVILVLHSALDLDLALGYLGICLWGLIGMLDGLSLALRDAEGAQPQMGRAGRFRHQDGLRLAPGLIWPRVAIGAIMLVLCFLAISLFAANRLGSRAVDLAQAGRVQAAYPLVVKASSYDPWARPLRVNRALLSEMMYAQTHDRRYLDEAIVQAHRAVDTEPYSPIVHQVLGEVATRHGDYVTAAAAFQRALELNPCRTERYEDAARAGMMHGTKLLTSGSHSEAAKAFQQVALLPSQMAATATAIPGGAPPRSSLVSVSPRLNLYAGEALLLLGQEAQAMPLLVSALEDPPPGFTGESGERMAERRAEAAIWLSAAYLQQGDTERAQSYLKVAVKGAPQADELLEQILQLLNVVTEATP